jgi:hypothetical protein
VLNFDGAFYHSHPMPGSKKIKCEDKVLASLTKRRRFTREGYLSFSLLDKFSLGSRLNYDLDS